MIRFLRVSFLSFEIMLVIYVILIKNEDLITALRPLSEEKLFASSG